MKKVNKQCLLDTPRIVRVSEKNWQAIVQTSRPHAYVQCVYIISTKYQIAQSKAIVGVERPIKALSMHIQSHIRE